MIRRQGCYEKKSIFLSAVARGNWPAVQWYMNGMVYRHGGRRGGEEALKYFNSKAVGVVGMYNVLFCQNRN